MGSKYNIDDVKDVVKTFLSFTKATAMSVLDDGVITVMDLPKFMSALSTIPAAVSGAVNIPAQLSDMDAKERDELIAFVRSEFDIPNDLLESIIERVLIMAINFISMITDFGKIRGK